jgi:hypothetical protein
LVKLNGAVTAIATDAAIGTSLILREYCDNVLLFSKNNLFKLLSYGTNRRLLTERSYKKHFEKLLEKHSYYFLSSSLNSTTLISSNDAKAEIIAEVIRNPTGPAIFIGPITNADFGNCVLREQNEVPSAFDLSGSATNTDMDLDVGYEGQGHSLDPEPMITVVNHRFLNEDDAPTIIPASLNTFMFNSWKSYIERKSYGYLGQWENKIIFVFPDHNIHHQNGIRFLKRDHIHFVIISQSGFRNTMHHFGGACGSSKQPLEVCLCFKYIIHLLDARESGPTINTDDVVSLEIVVLEGSVFYTCNTMKLTEVNNKILYSTVNLGNQRAVYLHDDEISSIVQKPDFSIHCSLHPGKVLTNIDPIMHSKACNCILECLEHFAKGNEPSVHSVNHTQLPLSRLGCLSNLITSNEVLLQLGRSDKDSIKFYKGAALTYGHTPIAQFWNDSFQLGRESQKKRNFERKNLNIPETIEPEPAICCGQMEKCFEGFLTVFGMQEKKSSSIFPCLSTRNSRINHCYRK